MSQDLPEQPNGQTPPPAAPPPPPYQQPPAGQQPPPYQAGAPAYGSGPQQLSQSDERMWAMLGHLGGILLGFISPLIVWLVFRERSAFVNDQGREALNFQITLAIAQIVSALLWVVVVGFLGTAVFTIVGIVFPILAGLAANKGEAYRYPVALRLIK